VEIWVTDEEGNKDFCKTSIEIQDPNDVCPNNIVKGRIVTMLNGESLGMAGVSAQLYQNGALIQSIDLSAVNTFEFKIQGLSGDIEVKVVKNTEPIGGITAADASAIFKMLLGKQDFDHAAQRIAADVNGDCRISVGDAAMLHKLLLGKIDDFTSKGVNSYVFLPVNDPDFNMTTFCDPQGMFTIDVNNILDEYQFLPIKMGDIR
jgi:hypothetical protein